nr:YetF domain-containing protein [Paracoccus nototheniae]
MLVHDGRYPDAVLKTQKVARNEVAAALRQSGKSGIEGILSVVLETDGSMTVTPG